MPVAASSIVKQERGQSLLSPADDASSLTSSTSSSTDSNSSSTTTEGLAGMVAAPAPLPAPTVIPASPGQQPHHPLTRDEGDVVAALLGIAKGPSPHVAARLVRGAESDWSERKHGEWK